MQIAQPPQAATTTALPTSATPKKSTEISSDFTTFLKMLTAQMKNQSPLNPIESADFAVQLATFSGIEQQVKTNNLLESLAGQLGSGGMGKLAGWVGMDARAAAPAHFSGSPVTIVPKPLDTADQAVLVVRDSTGAEVQRAAIPISGQAMQWAGVSDNGTPLAPSQYSFKVESYGGGKLLGTTTAETYSRIREARIENGTGVLVLDGGATVSPDDVTALRQAGPTL